MSKENVRLFNEKVSADKALQGKLHALNERHEGEELSDEKMMRIYEEDVLPLARECGFDFSMEDLKEYARVLSQSSPGELTEDELDAVAGGNTCACVIGGGGKGSESSLCVCVAFGTGSNRFGGVCVCVVGGGGKMP